MYLGRKITNAPCIKKTNLNTKHFLFEKKQSLAYMQTQKNRTHTTKKIGFYDTLTTSVLLNRCGIISGGNFIIIKLENEDSDIQARL